jgi:hypothetical protein
LALSLAPAYAAEIFELAAIAINVCRECHIHGVKNLIEAKHLNEPLDALKSLVRCRFLSAPMREDFPRIVFQALSFCTENGLVSGQLRFAFRCLCGLVGKALGDGG